MNYRLSSKSNLSSYSANLRSHLRETVRPEIRSRLFCASTNLLLYMRFVSVINCNEHSKNGFQRITKFVAPFIFIRICLDRTKINPRNSNRATAHRCVKSCPSGYTLILCEGSNTKFIYYLARLICAIRRIDNLCLLICAISLGTGV